jgi:mono/diheme cytochrome c family protein
MTHPLVAAFAAALAAACLGALAQQAPSGDAARGKNVFMNQGCFTCHGTVGHGGPYGPRLAPHPMPWEAFANQVHHPRASMPRYAPAFVSGQDLADMYAYLQSIKPGPKASDIPLLKD